MKRLLRERPQNEEQPKSDQELTQSQHQEVHNPNLQVTNSRNDQHRIVSQKAEKGSQQLLRKKYENGDSEVGLLGEPS